MVRRIQSWKSWYGWTIGLVFLGAVILRLQGIQRSMWQDEWSTMQRLRLGVLQAMGTDPSSFFYNLLIRSWGEFESPIWYLRGFSILLSVYLLVFVFVWLRNQSKLTALCGLMLFGYLPFFVMLSSEMRWYSLSILCGAATLICADLATDRSRKHSQPWGQWFIVAVTLTALSHPTGALWALLLVLHWFILEMQRSNRSQTKGNSRAMIVAFIALLVFTQIILVSGYVLKSQWWPAWWPRWIPPIGAMSIQRMLVDTFGLHENSTGLRWLVAALAAGWSGYVLLAGNMKRNWPYLFLPASYLLMVLMFSIAVSPIVLVRTMVPFWTSVCFFILVQLVSMDRPPRLRATLGLGAITAFFIGLQLSYPVPPRGQWKEMAERLMNTYTPPYVIAEPAYAGGLLSYYLPGSRTIDLTTETAVKQMRAMGSVFLVKNERPSEQIFRAMREGYQVEVLNQAKPFVAQFWRPGSRNLRMEDPNWALARQAVARGERR